MKKILILAALIPCFFAASAQTVPCEVQADSLKGTYTGDCKKGLANGIGVAEGRDKYNGEFKKGLPDGFGIYTWKSGTYYTGNWKKGMRDGKGTMHMADKDSSILAGFWKKGEYKGEYEVPWVFHKLPLVLSNSVRKNEDKSNTVLIKVEGGLNGFADVSKFTLAGGNYMRQDIRKQIAHSEIEFQQVIFPFRVRIESGSDFIDVEIFEKGSWEVYIKF